MPVSRWVHIDRAPACDVLGLQGVVSSDCHARTVTKQHERSVGEQIGFAIDPKGERRSLLQAVDELPEWLVAIDSVFQSQVQEARRVGREYDELRSSMEAALTHLVPLGWSPFNMSSARVREAVELVTRGDARAADDLLAQEWDGEGGWRTKQVCDRVRTMGSGYRQRAFENLCRQRARLLMLAKSHHDAGRYEASIPIIHAQMEGIAMDVSDDRKFFTKGSNRADLVNPTQLVAVEACLATLQGVFGQDVRQTQAAGSLSRHGIAHGRELAYDTRVNSAKSWSALDALVEWARPLAQAKAQRLLRDQQLRNAGSQEVDAEGRRLDDREFRETRLALHTLVASAMGWWDRAQRFRPDLVGAVYDESHFVEKGLPEDHGIQSRVSEDGQTVWYWRVTISGWVLGLAAGRAPSGFREWQFSGPCAPKGSPAEAPAEWGALFETLADWT